MAEKIFSIERFLNPIRLRYPWFIGSALWLAWCISIALGLISGKNTDSFGQLIGTDFSAFYTAGEIIRIGRSAQLYDPSLAIEIQTRLYGYEPQDFNPYLNPPFYAWIFVPFSILSYPASPLLWMGLNLLFLFLAIKALGMSKSWPIFLLALTWIPAWSAISFGQNAFLSVLILSLVYFLQGRQKYFFAGAIAGLLLYKPQLLIGVFIIWILDWKSSWKSLFGCLTSGIVLAGSSYVLMPEATQQYMLFSQKISSSLMTHPAFPIWNAHGTFTFWLGVFPSWPPLSKTFYMATIVTGGIVFVKFYFSYNISNAVKFGSAILLTLWVTPYLMIYDWSLLLIPAILFWQEYPEYQQKWKVIFAILWVVFLISGPLTAAQWRWSGWAIQLSVPALAVAIYLTIYILGKKTKREIPDFRLSKTVIGG